MPPVDTVLSQARELLGAVTPPQVNTPQPGTQIPSPPVWSGAAADAAITTSADLDRHRTHLHLAHTSAGAVINDAAQISHTARTQLRTVETAWAADKIAVGPYGHTPEGKAELLRAGQQRIHEATQVVQTAAAQFQGAARQVHALAGRLPETGGKSESQMFGPAPQAPATKDPPHGEDSRYWIDTDQLQYVPDGDIAPNGYVQVGPNLYHPMPGYPLGSSLTPALSPLDAGDLVHVEPGQLGPAQTREFIPGWFTPVPVLGEVPGPPQQPVDIRDVIEVPAGALAPGNYFQYLPGWWAPRPDGPR